MAEQSLDGIRRESIRRIFSCIRKNKNVSRHRISEETGLSLMTVGKITDMLSLRGVVVCEKKNGGGVGRKAESISVSGELFAAVIEISRHDTNVFFLDFELSPRHSFKLPRDVDNDDFFSEFMKFVFEHELIGKLVGAAFAYEDETDKQYGERLSENFRDKLGLDSFCTEPLIYKSNGAHMISGNTRSIIYLTSRGDDVRGRYIGEERQTVCGSFDRAATDIEDRIASLIDFLSPEEVFLDGIEVKSDDLGTKVNDELASKFLCIGCMEHIIDRFICGE